MGAIGIINRYSQLKDVSFERTDGSPAQDLDSPIYYTASSRLYMGPVSGGGGGGGSFSMGVSTGGNTLGLTGVTGTRVVLAGGGEITLSQSRDGNGGTITVSAPPQSAQTQNRFNLTLDGNTAGALQEVSSGTLTLAGGANITISQNGNAITISGNAGGVETQTAISGIGNSETTYTSGTVRLSELGAVTIRSTTGQQLQISVAPQSVQPETQTFLGGLAASNTTYTSGTVSIVGSGDITVSSGTGQRVIIFGSQSVQPETQTFVGGIAASNTTYTSGTITITGVGGGVTVSSNTGQRIDISVAAPVAQTNQAGSLFAVGNTTSSTSGSYDARTLSIRGDGMISVAATNSGFRISATQSVQSLGLYALGNTTGQSSSTTRDARSISVEGAGIISVGYSGGSLRISATESVQTQNVHNVTLSGNTAGVMAQISSGTMTLAGGNNITVSQNGNAITISGANVGGAQTGISGIIASDATYTSGTVEFTGSGIVTIRSSAGQRVVVDASQSVQSLGLYAEGNTTGQSSSTTRDARTLSIRGDGIVSVGYSNGSLRISASQSVQAETQTFVGGLANSQTTYTSGTIGLSELGAITIRSTTGNQFQLSVNAQTGTQFSAGLTNAGNTAGDTGTVAGRLVLVGSNNITLSGSTNGASQTISIFGTAGGGGFSGGVSNIGNTAGDTGVTGTRLVLAGGQSITLSQATDANGGTVTISGASTSQSVQSLGMYALGNTTGQSSSTTMDARTLSIRGDGIVSLGYSNGSLRISASQSVQPETQTFLGGIAASDKTYTSGTVVLTGAGGGITVQSNAGQTITLSVAAPVAQTNQTLGMYAVQNTTGQSSSTTMDARTLSIAGDGIVSVGYSAGSLRISAAQSTQTQGILSAGVSNLGNTAGNTQVSTGSRLVFAGAGDISLSQATAAGASTISISGSQSVQTQGILSAGVSTGGNTQGNTQVSTGSRLVLVGSGMISASQGTAAGASTITLNATQSNQSLGMYAVQNTTGQSSSTTMDARTLSVAGDGAVSVGYSAGSLRISAPVQTVESQSIGASNLGNTLGTSGVASGGQVRVVINGTSNITISQSVNGASATLSLIGQPSFSGGVSNLGNSAGATGVSGTRMVLVGSNNITLSQTTDANGATISINAPSPGAAQYSVGVSNIGNTAGNTGVTGTRIVFAGTPNITLSQSTDATGATISMSGNPAFSAGVSNLGNTAGDTGVSGTRMVVVGTGPISLSQATAAAGNTISIDAPATSSLVGASGISVSTNGSTISVLHTSGGPGFLESWFPHSVAPHTFGQQGNGTLHVQPMPIPTDIRMDRILLPVVVSNATNSSNSFTLSYWAGIYTRNASTLSLVTSISTSTNFSAQGTTGSYSLFGGRRWLSAALTTTLSSGDYWIAIGSRTTTGGGAGQSVSQILMTQQSNATFSGWSGLMGAATNASMQYQKGLGTYTATTLTPPAAIPFASLTGSGTLVMQPPIYALVSGTV